MRRRIVLISGGIVGMVLLLVVLVHTTSNNTFVKDGVTYALTLDGASTNSFPAMGMYQVDVSCTNARGKWDYEAWKLYIDNITGNVSCDIGFNTITKTYLNNKVKELAGTTQGTGQVVNEKGYRYEGQNPNNYVWFNNELWRIIGVFDSASHGQSGQDLVKIIRANPIGGLAWDKSETNDWSNSSLKNLLNGAYYNAQDGTNGEYCYGYSTTAKAKCDYRNVGIQSNYRNMIKEVTWYLGGYSKYASTAEKMYGYERGTTVPSGNQTSWTGKIGLMYTSDYGYAVPATNCARYIPMDAYNNPNCTLNNWIYGQQGEEWTITPDSDDVNAVFIVYSNGTVESSFPEYGTLIRPVLYLDNNTYVISGNGSETDPYIIGM